MTAKLDFHTACYSHHLDGSLAIIDFSGDIYQLGTCMETKATFLSLLHSLNDSPEIKGLLLLNSPGVFGDEKYCHFMHSALVARGGRPCLYSRSAKLSDNPIKMERWKNALSQITQEVLKFKKLLIVGFEGDVASSFFGTALAADYRYGTDEMTFQSSHLRLGLPPGGGLGFFLPRFTSQPKARDLLFSTEPTSASDLHQLGLLDGHFPSSVFRNECKQIASDLIKMPIQAIVGVKSITQRHCQDLIAFHEYEDRAMDQACAKQIFHKG